MPLSCEGREKGFPVNSTNSYGRMMIKEQMRVHDELIESAPTLIDTKVAPVYLRQMEIQHAQERWRPSYNEQKRRADDDILLANLIRDSHHMLDDRLDAHILRFREHRAKNPRHKLSWLQAFTLKKANETHDQVIRDSQKWVDDEPPKVALHYRKILRRTPFTKGGFPRIDSFKMKEKVKSSTDNKPVTGACLPGR